MAAQRTAPVCLISALTGPTKVAWRAAFVECIKAAGLTPVDYSPGAVEGATCMLAFAPSGESEVLFQAAYAMGRGVPVLVVGPSAEEMSRYDPKPADFVEIEIEAPDAIAGARESITSTLVTMSQGQLAPTTRAPRSSWSSAERAGGPATAMVTTVDQAEALFEAFIADGLSERLVHRLLLEAGCRGSWVEFRLQQQFGGW